MLWLRSKLLEQVKPSKYVLSITPFALSSSNYDGRTQDAAILSTILGEPSVSLDNIPTALKVYDEIRRPFALDIQERSRLNGQQASLWREDDLENLHANHHNSIQWGMYSTRTFESMDLKMIDTSLDNDDRFDGGRGGCFFESQVILM